MDKINVRCYLKSVKQYNEKVLDFILFLFKDITKKRWEWEYLHSPSKSIVKVCTHNNNIIGHYALILFPMLLSGRVVSGGKAEGSLVDINAIRRLQKADRNVFGKLIKSCLSEFSCHKKFAVFGFPNSKALTSQLKHGYECIKVEGCEKIFFRDALYTLKGVNKYIKPLLTVLSISYTKIVDFFITLLFSNTSAISKISENDIHDLNIFSLKISRKYPHTLMIHRTYQYFKWRILDNPYAYGNVLLSKSKDGDINALLAYSIEENKYSKYIKIQDIAILDVQSGKLLRNKILNIMKDYSINYFVLWELNDYSAIKGNFNNFIPFIFRKNVLDKNMIFNSNLFKDSSQYNIDVSPIYKRF